MFISNKYTTLIPGAGFSKAFGFPLGAELKKIVLESGKIGNSDGHIFLKKLNEVIPINHDKTSIDAILTGVDALIDLGYGVAKKLKKIIKMIIVAELHKCFRDISYNAFLKNVPRFQDMEYLFSAIITFNWDTLFEDILLDQSRIFNDSPVFYPTDSSKDRVFVKLHGSVDWYLIPQYFSELLSEFGLEIDDCLIPILARDDDHTKPIITDDSMDLNLGIFEPKKNMKMESEHEYQKVITLQTLLNEYAEPAILIPSQRKSPNDLFLRPFWDVAREVLKKSWNIVVVGYSLPEDDHHAIALLRNAVIQRQEKGLETKLIIVDPIGYEISLRYTEVLGDSAKIVVINNYFDMITNFDLQEHLLVN